MRLTFKNGKDYEKKEIWLHFDFSYDGIVEGHKFWMSKVSQFQLLKGDALKDFKFNSTELFTFIENLLLYSKLSTEENKNLLNMKKEVGKYIN